MTTLTDYTPVDLSSVYNAGPEAIAAYGARSDPPDDVEPPLRGEQSFRGIPFHIGAAHDQSGPCFVRLSGGAAPVGAARSHPGVMLTGARMLTLHTHVAH